jgi:hypothetical protein
MPLEFDVCYFGNGYVESQRLEFWNDGRNQEFTTELGRTDVVEVVFDPAYHVLCKAEESALSVALAAEVQPDGVTITGEVLSGEIDTAYLYRLRVPGSSYEGAKGVDFTDWTLLNVYEKPESFTFTDRRIPSPGEWSWLLSVAPWWSEQFYQTEPLTWEGRRPRELVLANPWPSPAADVVNLRFDLPEAGPVELAAYDLAGRLVATLVEGDLAAGRHEVSWDASSVPSGVYLVLLDTDSGRAHRRLVVAR